MRNIRSPLDGFSLFGGRAAVEVAPPYEEPDSEEPLDPPEGEPDPPIDTPTDPETDEPEPGVDEDFAHPTRLEIEGGQAVIRTTNDPGTFGNAYIAAALDGGEYWEFHVHNSTPQGATFAVGVTTLDMPLNGIPGERATELAWWSDGTIRQDGVTLLSLGSAGTLSRGQRGAIGYAANGDVYLWRNCSALNGGEAVGNLSEAANVYPFAALYSVRTRLNFVFSTANFGCPLPVNFRPIGYAALLPPANLQSEVIIDA
jgi:hypothetical protein